jgi:hypothetical protein
MEGLLDDSIDRLGHVLFACSQRNNAELCAGSRWTVGIMLALEQAVEYVCDPFVC